MTKLLHIPPHRPSEHAVNHSPGKDGHPCVLPDEAELPMLTSNDLARPNWEQDEQSLSSAQPTRCQDWTDKINITINDNLPDQQGRDMSNWDTFDHVMHDHTYGENSKVMEDVLEKEEEHEKGWDGVSSELEVGMTFELRSQVKKFMSQYGERTHSSMVVTVGGASDGCKSKQVNLVFFC